MPYQGLADGLYFVVQQSTPKAVDHYGILDIGNRRRAPEEEDGYGPVILHQRPPGITANWLHETGEWRVLNKIADEAAALERVRLALNDSAYKVLRHNCEHFARWVAFGSWESKQLQAAGWAIAIAVVTISALNDAA